MKKRITAIQIITAPDYDADLSYLGTFSDKAETKIAVDHFNQLGYEPRNTLQFFNPQSGTCENEQQALETYKRMMDFEKGNVSMLSIRARATIETSTDGKTWLANAVESGGLYGIESDSGRAEQDEIAHGQLDELTDVLSSLGFTLEEIATAKLQTENVYQ